MAGARFEFSDGSTKSFYFQDKRGWQTVTLATPKKTSYVKMTILSVYHGGGSAHASSDTDVSEMAFTGWSSGETP